MLFLLELVKSDIKSKIHKKANNHKIPYRFYARFQ